VEVKEHKQQTACSLVLEKLTGFLLLK